MKLITIKKGFTLIEVLISLGIIGILATLILVGMDTSRTRARETKARSEISQFVKTAVIAQAKSGRTLKDICNGETNADTETKWNTCRQKIAQEASDYAAGINQMAKDPWGRPYILDPNEGDSAYETTTKCMPDVIWSKGADNTGTSSLSFPTGKNIGEATFSKGAIGATIPFISEKCRKL